MSTRRGVVFTLVALILVAYLLAADRVSDRFTVGSSDATIAATRVSVLDAYLVSFEEHASASVATAGYLAFANLSKSVYLNGTYVDDINRTLFDCIIADRIALVGVTHHCLPNATLVNHSLNVLTDIGVRELGVTTTYVLHNVTVTETRPFEVVMRLELSYNITDAFGSFRREHRNVTATIDLRGVEDPVYASLRNLSVINEPAATHAFFPTRLLRFALNISSFGDIYLNHTYVTYPGQSPSILQRYRGQLSSVSACCGIESVVNRSSLITPTAAVYMNLSLIDHQLARHIAGTLPEYGCVENEVRAFDEPGTGTGTVVMETQRFDNVYNLTGAQLPQCQWS